MTNSAHVWRALADPTRREILDLLRAGPRTTGQVCAAFPLSRFAVMKHLGVLDDAGLVTVQRRGRERWNYLNAVPLRQELERWLTPFSTRLADAAIALKRAVEADHSEGEAAMTDQQPRVARGEIDTGSEIEIAAPREKVFAALTEVGHWWPHRFREGSEVVFEAHVGGRFYEDWGDGNGALYGVVGALHRPEKLSITGPMGIRGPVSAVWAVELDDAGPNRTVVRGTHRAFGDIDGETAQSYREGWVGVYAALEQHLGVA